MSSEWNTRDALRRILGWACVGGAVWYAYDIHQAVTQMAFWTLVAHALFFTTHPATPYADAWASALCLPISLGLAAASLSGALIASLSQHTLVSEWSHDGANHKAYIVVVGLALALALLDRALVPGPWAAPLYSPASWSGLVGQATYVLAAPLVVLGMIWALGAHIDGAHALYEGKTDRFPVMAGMAGATLGSGILIMVMASLSGSKSGASTGESRAKSSRSRGRGSVQAESGGPDETSPLLSSYASFSAGAAAASSGGASRADGGPSSSFPEHGERHEQELASLVLSPKFAVLVGAVADPDHAFVRWLVGAMPSQAKVRDAFVTAVLDMEAVLDDPQMTHSLGLIAGLVHDYASTTSVEARGTLFRGNSGSMKMLSLLARRHSVDYLSSVLGPIVSDMYTRPNVSFETNPVRLPDGATDDELAANRAALQATVLAVLDAVLAAQPPPLLIAMAQTLATTLDPMFPDHAVEVIHNAAANLLFLRLIVPAIVTPVAYGVASVPPDTPARRKLVLVASIVQTIVNRMTVSHKEAYLQPLNPFIESQISRVTAWYDALLAQPIRPDAPLRPVPPSPLSLTTAASLLDLLAHHSPTFTAALENAPDPASARRWSLLITP